MLLEYLAAMPVLFLLVCGLLGLMVGSFLNVVIYRLPIMMQREWRKDCQEYLELPVDPVESPFNLILPRSRCSVCQTVIKAHHNIPVVSYLFLHGKCGYCRAAISLRYPSIEIFTGIISLLVGWHFGATVETVFALLLSWSLIALSFIDIDCQLLPDNITLPLLWLGLALSLFDVYVDVRASIIGAMAGYLSLWSIYHLFKLLTGKEGMGFGDFKLLAALGAWLGWQALPAIIFLSSLLGAVIGIGMILLRGHDRNKPIPYGPYLALAGWITLIWGNPIKEFYTNFLNL